ncbi:C-type lectin domain family 4 member C-like isoform X2 [Oryzias latipes]|uniref:C-type lectin domain family 4 member C-like isoform X2 n=1 Tax=Oryzias latipes TaxID=8090 RepID=UPI0005CC6AA4|nr:C-type lectin domain family 4 member C-like isoform X2 [Oryzias latipes]
MSSDMLAKPDSSKVIYNGKQLEDTSDWKECEVKTYNDAYESVEDTRRVQSPEQETCPEVQKRFCRCEQWCLLVLCTVLSAGSIILSSYMVVNNYNLQMEVKELKKNSEELMSTFSANNSRLQDEMQQLRDENEAYDGQWCPEGWRRFGSSCYYKSTEQKTWTDSRSFCQKNGSDLVVVNSKEEQQHFKETL